MDLVIVQRGNVERFRALEGAYRSNPSVHVMWDRRVRDRRQNEALVCQERRSGERRGAPPASWITQGYVFVEHAPAAARTLPRP